jgi:hypothetical protein
MTEDIDALIQEALEFMQSHPFVAIRAILAAKENMMKKYDFNGDYQ